MTCVDTQAPHAKESLMRRTITAGLGALVIALAVAGCGSDSDKKPAATTTTKKLTKVTFVADYNPAWIAQVPWTVAMEKGWYKEAGLDIDYKLPPSNSDPPRIVGTGKADVTVSYSPDLLVARSKGLDVKALGSLMDQNIEGIMTFDKSVRQPKQLEGKTVAIYDFPMAQINWKTFTDFYKIDRTKVKQVSEGSYGVPLIVSNKVDAIDGAAGAEVTDAELKKKQKSKFWVYQQQNGIPNFYWFVMAANGDFVNKNPAAAKAFVTVTMRGLTWATEHPKEAADIFAKANPRATSVQLAEEGWQNVLRTTGSRFNSSGAAGAMDPSVWKSYAAFLTKQKLLTSDPHVDELLTNNAFVAKGSQ